MDIIDCARNINKSHTEDVLERLFTPWGEALKPDHVLQEYPRPLMRRENYLNLNGYWNYSITKTPDFPSGFDGKILVPFSPESMLSGVERQLLPEEYLWYERRLTVSEHQLTNQQRLLLHFGAVDQMAYVYVNGAQVCSHSGGYLPFETDITDALQPGENTLLVRVQDSSDTSYHSRGKQTLKRGGMFYTAQSGIWQTVWLEWVPEHYIKKIKTTPDYDKGEIALTLSVLGKEAFSIQIFADTNYNAVHKDLRCGSRCIFDFSFESDSLINANDSVCSAVQFTIRAKLPELYPWTPENPFLYTMRLSYGKDTVESYFALRCFGTEPDENGNLRFCLNHKPLFLHGVLDQGYWPDGLYTAPSDDALIYDIRTMQQLGFNMMRKHIKIEAARWYYHCDRLGMLVWQDMVCGGAHYSMPMVCYLPTLFPGISGRIPDDNYKLFGRLSRQGREEWTEECIASIDCLYNVPSIAVWVPFNEGWGQFDANKITALIKEKDPTRLIDQTSGWFDQEGGDFKSVHNYFRKLKVLKDKRAFVISEYGGYACHIEEHSSVKRIYGYKKYDTMEDFTAAYHKLMEQEIKPLISKGLCGAVYTQVSDVEEEVNGLLTYDRKICKLLR